MWFEFIFLDVPDRQVLNSPKRPTRLKVTSNGNTDHVTYIVIILVVVVVCVTISCFVYKHRKYNYIRRKNEVVWIYNSENVHGFFFFYRNQLRFSHRVIITFFSHLYNGARSFEVFFKRKKSCHLTHSHHIIVNASCTLILISFFVLQENQEVGVYLDNWIP